MPAAAVFNVTPSALLLAPAPRPEIEPLPVKPVETCRTIAFSRSVKASGDTFVTPSCVGWLAPPTREATVTVAGLKVGLASR